MDHRRALATAALLCSCILFAGSLLFAVSVLLARPSSPPTGTPIALATPTAVDLTPTSAQGGATATANSPTISRPSPTVAAAIRPAQQQRTPTPTDAPATIDPTETPDPTEPPEPAIVAEPTPSTSDTPLPSDEPESAAAPPSLPDPTATDPPLPPAGTAAPLPVVPPPPAASSSAGIADSSVLPARLLIPRLGVDAPVGYVGLERDGSMATPKDAWSAGWYALGARPGQPGNAVITGHVDYHNVGPAVFWDLHRLAPNDVVLVVTGDGTRLRFVVVATTSYTMAGTPLDRIFGPADAPNLNLITCGGTFNQNTREYDRRVVVYTVYAGQE